MADKTAKNETQTPNNGSAQAQQGFPGWNGFEWPQMAELFQMPEPFKIPQMFQMNEMFQVPEMFKNAQIPGQEAWSKAMADHVTRMEGWMGEVQAQSKRQAEQAEKAIDEMARLSKASMNYSLELQTRAHTMFMDSARKAAAASSTDKKGAVA